MTGAGPRPEHGRPRAGDFLATGPPDEAARHAARVLLEMVELARAGDPDALAFLAGEGAFVRVAAGGGGIEAEFRRYSDDPDPPPWDPRPARPVLPRNDGR